MTSKRHLRHGKNLLAVITKRLILMRKQLKMIFKQTLTKIILMKKQLLILTIIIPFYKLMLITRNATRCNNRDDLLHLSLSLKISVTSMIELLL